MKSRRSSRETALQALYCFDTVNSTDPDSVALFFKHFLNLSTEELRRAANCSATREPEPLAQAAPNELPKDHDSHHDTRRDDTRRDDTRRNDIGHDLANDIFALRLVQGVLDKIEAIDSELERASAHWTLPRMARVDRNILRIATYELLFCEEIPVSVSINEAIEIAKRFSAPEASLFINGVLDKVAHQIERVSAANE